MLFYTVNLFCFFHMSFYLIDIDEFLRESHPLKQILAKVEGMDGTDDVLGRLKGRKAVFSNGPSFYVRALVEALGLEAHFDGLFGTDDFGLLYKPNPQAYLNVCRLLGVKPEQCIMVDDSADQSAPSQSLGHEDRLVRRKSPSVAIC